MKLMNNLSIEQRMNTEWGDKFYPEQRAEILDGARLGINAEAYANPDYDHGIMKEIKVGLLQDPSLEKYIDAFVQRYTRIENIYTTLALNNELFNM